MKTQAAPLSADERLKIASLIGTAVTAERKREEIPNPCPAGASFKEGRRMGQLGRRPDQ